MKWMSVALAVLIAPIAVARTRNISIHTEDDSVLTSCDQVEVRFTNGSGYRAEEQVPVANLRSLRLHAAQNGGIYVTGSNTGSYSVKACKAAELESTLRDLRINLSGDEITADAPDGSDDWVVYFIVTVPRNASLNLDSRNGPITLQEVAGTVTARAVNGPISVKHSSGTMDLETQNGPISLAGGSGTMKLNATNGPISIKFDESSWNGSLDARTQNGPLSVKMPRGFRSGMVIESDGHGPVTCRADACRDSRRVDDDDLRRIEIGRGPTIVHMSTVNGPVSVKEND